MLAYACLLNPESNTYLQHLYACAPQFINADHGGPSGTEAHMSCRHCSALILMSPLQLLTDDHEILPFADLKAFWQH